MMATTIEMDQLQVTMQFLISKSLIHDILMKVEVLKFLITWEKPVVTHGLLE